MESEMKPQSLVDLCVQKTIDNLHEVGHVDDVPTELLRRILPHCTMQQLTRIENRTMMDLSHITNPLWRRFYQKEFGEDHTNLVIERMNEAEVTYKWRDLFKAKTKEQLKLKIRCSRKSQKSLRQRSCSTRNFFTDN